jgi:hypothetical protein
VNNDTLRQLLAESATDEALGPSRVNLDRIVVAGRRSLIMRRAAIGLVAVGVLGASLAVPLWVRGPTTAPQQVTIPAATTATDDPAHTGAPATTAELIEAWALELESGPTAPASSPGQTITVTVHSVLDGEPTEPGRFSVEREGLMLVDGGEFSIEQRDRFAQTGPTFLMPTAEWFSGLDTHPESLLQVIKAGGCWVPCANDYQVFGAIADLLRMGDITVPPTVRAGLMRVLGSLDGTTAYEATVDGRELWAIGFPEGPFTVLELYFDPATKRYTGSGALTVATTPDLPECTPRVIVSTDTHQNLDRSSVPEWCNSAIPLPQPVRNNYGFTQQALVTP